MLILTVTAPLRAVDEESVNRAIERGRRALLEAITDIAEIEYTPKAGQASITIRARVENDRGGALHVVTLEGKRLVILKRTIVRWVRAGHVHPEMDEPMFYSGPTALVALALVLADVPTTDPTLAMAIDALANDDATAMGTYVRSLRATLWSALLERPISKQHRVRYGKLLREDVGWLLKAMKPGGSWDYGNSPEDRTDNSNGQFANLGLWAGSVANVEIPRKAWQAIEDHWLNTQEHDGGWNYGPSITPTTPSMTVAGCNSLYIILDRYHTQYDGAYAQFEGIRPKKGVREAINKVYAAIEAADDFLQMHRPNTGAFHGYELFGLERLALASGRPMIGGVDWFERYADDAADRPWGHDSIGDAFALIFLVHGRAPVLIQKLEHGGKPDDWNYYHRDLFGLSRYFTRTFERICRWQRIGPNATADDMAAAPLLLISGRHELVLSEATRTAIAEYISRGGTVFLHADLSDAKFTRSATRLFESMYADEGLRFQPLPADHPVFHCFFGGDGWKRPIPLQGLSDASRVRVFLCPVDIAGAWHQGKSDRFEELFKIMANVRTYAAPPFGELPSRLRPRRLPDRFAEPWATLRITRLQYDGPWDIHGGAWTRFAAMAEKSVGVRLECKDPVKADRPIEGIDVLSISASRRVPLSPEACERIRAFMRDGGLVLIDATDGRPDGAQVARAVLESLCPTGRGVLPAEHPIFTGGHQGLPRLGDLRPTQAGISLAKGGAPPPILTGTVNGRIAVLACPFDLLAGIDGPFIWNRIGYVNEDTRRLVGYLLAWKAGEVKAK